MLKLNEVKSKLDAGLPLTVDEQQQILDQLVNAQAERKHWKRTAIYLANCHVATLESLPKSTPKATKVRYRSIGQVALECLDMREAIKHPQDDPAPVKARLIDGLTLTEPA